MKCFVISPIGEEGSDIRAHADEVFEHIIEPALENFGITPIRSDLMNEVGRISDQMFRAIFEYDLCIAVLTFANPNVYYELAVAQSASRPVIILIDRSAKLPFDVSDFRTLPYDLRITSFKQRTHIARLIGMLDELKAVRWRGDDVFRAYRRADDSKQIDVQSYGISIDQPTGTDHVDVVDLRGSFQLIPPGYELRTLRYYPRANAFIPHGIVSIDHATKQWFASAFDVGGNSGDERGIFVALAGSNAKILLDTWTQAQAVHSEVQKALRTATGEYGKWLPPIPSWPDDLIVCQRLMVKRK